MSFPDLPIPAACPDCGAARGGWVVGPNSQGNLGVQCGNGHAHSFLLSPEDSLRAQVTLHPEILTSRPARFVGGPRDGEVDVTMIYGNNDVGTVGSFDGATYRIESVDCDYVTWRFEQPPD